MSINYPISQVGGGGGVSAAEVSGAVTGGLDPIYNGSITLSGTKTLSGSLLVSGSEFSILGTTRSNVSVADDNLDIIVTGSNGAGTQILLDAKNAGGDSLIIAQAQTYVAAQAGTSGYPYYFVADSANKFTAIEADDNTAGIYVGGTGYASSVNIGTAGSRVVSIGNTSGSTQVIVSAGTAGTVITGALNVSGAITASVGGIKFPDGSIQTTAGGGGGSGTVNSGTTGYLAYYPSTGTTVDDTSIVYTNGTSVGIGTSSPNTSALLEMSSSNQGVLFPRISGSARAAMTAVTGLIVYQTDLSGSDGEGLYIYKSSGWVQII